MKTPKTIDEICGQPEGSFNKHIQYQKTLDRAGELWRKINIYTARKPINERIKDFKCPKCGIFNLDISWDKMGMSYKCLGQNCKFEYPN